METFPRERINTNMISIASLRERSYLQKEYITLSARRDLHEHKLQITFCEKVLPDLRGGCQEFEFTGSSYLWRGFLMADDESDGCLFSGSDEVRW